MDSSLFFVGFLGHIQVWFSRHIPGSSKLVFFIKTLGFLDEIPLSSVRK